MELMFSKKGIVYLSKTHVSLYYKDITNPLRIDFEKNILENPTETDKEWLNNKIKTIEDKVKLKQLKAVLILSKDLVFDKILDDDLQDKDKRELEINEFLAGLPIGVDLIEGKEFVKEGNVLVTATNKKLYLSLIEVLKPLNISIDYVLPEIVFNRVEFTKKFLEEVFRERVLLNFGNFLEEDNDSHKVTWSNIRKSLLVLVTIGVTVGIAAYFMGKFIPNIHIDFTKYLNNNASSETTKSHEITEQLTGTGEEQKPEDTTPAKSSFEVTIKNGTGIPGFAGEIADLVKDAGYTIINTSNANNFNYTNTIIEVDETTATAITEDIRTALKNTLKSFEIKKTKDLGNKIIITTGEVTKTQ